MALTDKQLEIISEALLPLFQYLETQVIIDVTNRIKNTLAYTRSAELLAESMQKLGYSPAKIRYEAMKLLKADAAFEKAVAQNTLEHKKKVKELLTEILGIAQEEKDGILKDAVDLSFLDDLGIWQQGRMELTDNSFLPQLVAAIQKQTAGELKNLTGTTGFKTMSGFEPMESLYRKELDKAMIKVCTGTYTREQVLYDVVHNLADSGLRTIDFASGYSMQLDTAVRVAMRTGAHQIAGKVTDKNIEKTGVNLVCVSTHWGARNEGTGHANHAEWQGKVYFIKNGEDYGEEADRIGQDSISDLWQATGYSIDGAHENDPLGLYGYNCRHRHYPWFEGISEFPKEDPEPKPVTINGKTYDYYAITQKQRSMERSIRALKREKEAIKALDMDTKEIKARIKRRIGQYEDFSEAAKVEPKYNRLRYECGTSDLKKTEAWKKYKTVVNDAESGIINLEVDELTPCLRRLRDDKIVDTGVFEISPTREEYKEWEFDWTLPEKKGYKVYELKAEGDYRTQGLIALKQDELNSAIHVDIIEAAPFNNPHNKYFVEKQYNGIGGHLFAEAVKQSYEAGFEGAVYFTAKTDLIEHYRKELGAVLVNSKTRTMFIDEEAAKKLYDRYYGDDKL